MDTSLVVATLDVPTTSVLSFCPQSKTSHMSLYYDAARFLAPSEAKSGSLKSRVFSSKELRSSPKQVYALVAEASKWSPILAEVVEKSQLLQHERKVSPFPASCREVLIDTRSIM